MYSQLVELVQLSVVGNPTCDEVKKIMHHNVLIKCFQLSEKLRAGVQDILRDLFQQGSLTGLQVAGSPAEYFVRVGIQLGEKMLKHSLSGGGHSAISSCSQACDNLCQGGATFSLKDWSNRDNRTT